LSIQREQVTLIMFSLCYNVGVDVNVQKNFNVDLDSDRNRKD